MGEPLDTNKELNTVGWSNIISGLTGGFTGRYGLARPTLTPALTHILVFRRQTRQSTLEADRYLSPTWGHHSVHFAQYGDSGTNTAERCGRIDLGQRAN